MGRHLHQAAIAPDHPGHGQHADWLVGVAAIGVLGGDERLRAVPLLFSALTVVAAYAYARSLPWPRLLINRLASVMAGVAALMMPSSLARDDLKQYTADAFFALVVLWLL